jgi:oxalate decarboxylase/phosphoglucose isomerase-like protein (cupin superfamily)
VTKVRISPGDGRPQPLQARDAILGLVRRGEHPSGSSIDVPPGWAHRSVNTGEAPLVLLALYPAEAKHDYASIAGEGLWARVVRDE